MLRLGNRQWNYLCAADWSLPGFELYLKKKLYIYAIFGGKLRVLDIWLLKSIKNILHINLKSDCTYSPI